MVIITVTQKEVASCLEDHPGTWFRDHLLIMGEVLVLGRKNILVDSIAVVFAREILEILIPGYQQTSAT